MTPDNLARVEAACTDLHNQGQPVTFTAVAHRTGISRTSLYRNPTLRAVIEEHRHHSHDPRTLTGLTAEIGHLRTAIEAIADRLRQQEERIRRLEPDSRRKTS
jgi:hypothetical protein